MNAYQRALLKERQEGSAWSLAKSVGCFRSDNPDQRSAEKYQEIFQNTCFHLQRQVEFDKCMLMCDILRLPSNTNSRLCRTILPGLKEKLRLLPLALDSPSRYNDPSSWYEGMLDEFVELDELLQQIDLLMDPTRPDSRPYEEFAPLSVSCICKQVTRLYTSQLDRVFSAWGSFFSRVKFFEPVKLQPYMYRTISSRGQPHQDMFRGN
ncbi:hypothetical protein Pst134EB_021868 [Puccinia striiformis f. sp. tritici]|nr:hypothetical protein Pst134EB_021868 [Puccinia striiformis f. sp. tritici]